MGLPEPSKKQLGEQSQAHILARLLELGYTVLIPYGDSSRYDLVIEDTEGHFGVFNVRRPGWREEIRDISSSAQHLCVLGKMRDASTTAEKTTKGTSIILRCIATK